MWNYNVYHLSQSSTCWAESEQIWCCKYKQFEKNLAEYMEAWIQAKTQIFIDLNYCYIDFTHLTTS